MEAVVPSLNSAGSIPSRAQILQSTCGIQPRIEAGQRGGPAAGRLAPPVAFIERLFTDAR
jgi:hypothetical protein